METALVDRLDEDRLPTARQWKAEGADKLRSVIGVAPPG